MSTISPAHPFSSSLKTRVQELTEEVEDWKWKYNNGGRSGTTAAPSTISSPAVGGGPTPTAATMSPGPANSPMPASTPDGSVLCGVGVWGTQAQ